jgi:DNA invertase Pin-like site-specific DNA recombinase
MTDPIKKIRCVVYTRKSSEEGLEQAFNSLDAQREAGMAYIASQKHEGWVCIPTHYDDGGYSGGSTERPALQQLLADIQAGKIDIIVVYKVDRLSRSLGDFAQMMTLFDKHNVSFVSVTQQFNTTTSMGRLTLNILLSFAQFEREVTGERIRDKFAASKKKGMWMGGSPPLGYMVQDRMLIIVPQEAELVKTIFTLYLECHSPLQVAQSLQQAGHTNKRWQTATGNWRGGGKITVSHLNKILRNVIYVGKVQHGKQSYPGQHLPIIDEALWREVHDSIQANDTSSRHHWHSHFLLKGKLKTHEDYCMSPSTTNKVNPENKSAIKKKMRYYVSRKALTQGYKHCAIKTLNADLLETLVVSHVMHYLFATCLHVFRFITLLAKDTERSHCLRQLIAAVTVGPERLDISINKSALSQLASDDHSHTTQLDANPPTIFHQPDIVEGTDIVKLLLPIQIKRMNGRRLIVSHEGKDLVLPAHAQPDPVLVQAIGRSFGWKKLLEQSPDLTLRELAKQCGYSDRYLSRQLPLTGLAPDILHRALSGTLPSSVTLYELEEASAFLSWHQQRSHLGLNQATKHQ